MEDQIFYTMLESQTMEAVSIKMMALVLPKNVSLVYISQYDFIYPTSFISLLYYNFKYCFIWMHFKM